MREAKTPSDIEAAIAQWETLASEAERMASWERESGIDKSSSGSSAKDHKAHTYRRTAEALRLELATGRPYCVCCLKQYR